MTPIPIVAFGNHKGGVGKTTISTKLAQLWAAKGFRVLFVDLDPQGASTMLLRERPFQAPLAAEEPGIYDVLCGGAPIGDAAIPTPTGVELLGADGELARAEVELYQRRKGIERVLRGALQRSPLAASWDVLVLDCPPSLGLLMMNGLMAATHLVVPTVPSLVSTNALRVFGDQVAEICEPEFNPDLQMLGFVINQADAREAILRQTRDLIAGEGGTLLGEVRADAKARGLRLFRERGRAHDDICTLARRIAEAIGLSSRTTTLQREVA